MAFQPKYCFALLFACSLSMYLTGCGFPCHTKMAREARQSVRLQKKQTALQAKQSTESALTIDTVQVRTNKELVQNSSKASTVFEPTDSTGQITP